MKLWVVNHLKTTNSNIAAITEKPASNLNNYQFTPPSLENSVLTIVLWSYPLITQGMIINHGLMLNYTLRDFKLEIEHGCMVDCEFKVGRMEPLWLNGIKMSLCICA